MSRFQWRPWLMVLVVSLKGEIKKQCYMLYGTKNCILTKLTVRPVILGTV